MTLTQVNSGRETEISGSQSVGTDHRALLKCESRRYAISTTKNVSKYGVGSEIVLAKKVNLEILNDLALDDGIVGITR